MRSTIAVGADLLGRKREARALGAANAVVKEENRRK